MTFTIKLQNNINGTYTVSGFVINQNGSIVEVSHDRNNFEDAKEMLDYYSDENGFECRRVVELTEYPPLFNPNLQKMRSFIFG